MTKCIFLMSPASGATYREGGVAQGVGQGMGQQLDSKGKTWGRGSPVYKQTRSP